MPKIVRLTESRLQQFIREAIDETVIQDRAEAQECLNFIVNSVEGLMCNYIELKNAHWSNVREGLNLPYARWHLKLIWRPENEICEMAENAEEIINELQNIATQVANEFGLKAKAFLNIQYTRVEFDVLVNDNVWAYAKWDAIPNRMVQ